MDAPAEELSGFLMKQGEKVRNWKQRWFSLRGSKLFYAEDRVSVENESGCLGIVPLEHSATHNLPSYVGTQRIYHGFEVHTPQRRFFFVAESDSRKKTWMEAIQAKSTMHRTPRKEGWLEKRGVRHKARKKRYFILEGTSLYYYEHREDPVPKGAIPLEGAEYGQSEQEEVERPPAFHILVKVPVEEKKGKGKDKEKDKDRTFVIYGPTSDDVQQWLAAIGDALKGKEADEEPEIEEDRSKLVRRASQIGSDLWTTFGTPQRGIPRQGSSESIEEDKKRADDAYKKRVEEEARRKREEEMVERRRRAEEEARRRGDEETARRLEEERHALEDLHRKEAEERRRREEEEAQQHLEEERRRLEEERKRMEEMRRRIEEEEARRKEEEERRLREEEERRKAEEERRKREEEERKQREIAEALQRLVEGFTGTVYRKGRKPRDRSVWWDKANNTISWGENRARGKTDGSVSVTEITEIRRGWGTPTFWSSGDKDNQERYVSLITLDKTLDLEAVNRAGRDQWYRWFEILLATHRGTLL